MRSAARSATLLAALAAFPPAAAAEPPAAESPAARLPAAERALGAVERVLARPEFQPPEKGLLTRAWEWVAEAIEGLVDWVLSRMADGLSRPGVFEVVMIGLIVVLLALFLHMAWTILAYREPVKARGDAAATGTRASLSPDPHLTEAARLAGQGEFLEAARALYRGVVLWLDGAGRARYHEFKTGGDYARELAGTPLAQHFREFLGSFYPVAYGGRPARADSYGRLRAAATRMGVPE